MNREGMTRQEFHLQMANVELSNVTSVSGTVVSLSMSGLMLDDGRFYEFGKHHADQLSNLHIYQNVDLLLNNEKVFAYTVPVSNGLYRGLFQLADFSQIHLHDEQRKVNAVITSTERYDRWDVFSVGIEQEGKPLYLSFTWGNIHHGSWSDEEFKCLEDLMVPGRSIEVLAGQIDNDDPEALDPISFLVEENSGYVLVGTGRYRCCTDTPPTNKSFIWVEKNRQDEHCICGLPSQYIDVLRQANYLNGNDGQVRCWNCRALQLGEASAYGPTRKGIQELYGEDNKSYVDFI